MEGSDSEVLNFGVAVSYEWVCHMIGSRPPKEGGPGRDYLPRLRELPTYFPG